MGVKQCHTETQNVCKTEYTVECEDAHHKHHHKRSAGEETAVESEDDFVAELEASSRQRRGAKLIAKPLKKVAFLAGLGSQTPASSDDDDDEEKESHVEETLCHHHPHTKCWDEPEEHCEYMRVKVAKKYCRKPKQW